MTGNIDTQSCLWSWIVYSELMNIIHIELVTETHPLRFEIGSLLGDILGKVLACCLLICALSSECLLSLSPPRHFHFLLLAPRSAAHAAATCRSWQSLGAQQKAKQKTYGRQRVSTVRRFLPISIHFRPFQNPSACGIADSTYSPAATTSPAWSPIPLRKPADPAGPRSSAHRGLRF